jgi:hypothetical protein
LYDGDVEEQSWMVFDDDVALAEEGFQVHSDSINSSREEVGILSSALSLHQERNISCGKTYLFDLVYSAVLP